jgi:hypothetical protein
MNSDGAFSVRSAYKMLAGQKSQFVDGLGGSGTVKENKEFNWKLLWKQECAPKTKHFLWRLAHNNLPWKLNFKRRGMEVDTRCPMCNRLDEDGGHIFLHCTQVKKLWRHLDMEEVRMRLCQCPNVQDMLMTIFGMDMERRLRVIALLWQWWTAQNKRNAKDGEKTMEEIVFQVRRWAMEFFEFYAHKGAKARKPEEERSWSPPAETDMLKINVDGAFSDYPKRGGWGFVIRDNLGQVAGAGAGRIEFPLNAVHTEVVASGARSGIELGDDSGHSGIRLQGVGECSEQSRLR